jgi:hypothetical protein
MLIHHHERQRLSVLLILAAVPTYLVLYDSR